MRKTAWQLFLDREKKREEQRGETKKQIRERKKQYLKIAKLFKVCGILSEQIANKL